MIRAGLIGFGLGGRVFHAPLLSSVEGLELAAIVERNSNHAAERYPGITTYRTFDSMLANSSLSLIVVTTPNDSHFEYALQALEAGKNVVVDKPMCVTSAEIAKLMKLAAARGVMLAPFHSRRWDGDFLTLKKLLDDGPLGRLVYFESNMDRWRPAPTTRMPWKNEPAQGGLLLDLGTHLADQPLALFGNPEAVDAEIKRERDGEGANDCFTLRLRYPGLTVVVSANTLSTLERPRYHLRGTKGNYWKHGVDPQEAALSRVTRVSDGPWGIEPTADWGTLCVDVDGGLVTRPIESISGDYRLYYAILRDALLGKGPVPVSASAAWRVARLLEWAAESAEKRREVVCDWGEEPN
ncbi:MAG TPA: Gfo/Idh/MocA family oxidoreductase [Terracidiphilus sp.]|nr:Gfo/Idh/MocA family oxidoreductase [Terracidiphilus sp.]